MTMPITSNAHSWQYRITLLLVLMMTVSTFLPIEVYSPSLPTVSKIFNVTPLLSKLTIVIFLLGNISSLLIYGPFADHFGSKKVLLYGLGIFLFGSYLAFLTNHFYVLIFARFIQGAGISVCAILSRTLLRNIVSGVEMARASSLVTAGVACASILSPIIGSYILHIFGYKAVFLFMSLYGTLLFLFVFGFYKTEEEAHSEKRTLIGCFADLIFVAKNRTFLLNVLISSVSLSLLYIYNIYNPFILQIEYHNNVITYGFVASMIFTGEIFGTFINIWLLKSLSVQKTILIAILIMLLVSLSTYLTLVISNFKSIYFLVLSLFIINSMGGIIMPNTFANAFINFNEKKGAASSAYSFLQICLSFIILSLINLFFIKPKFIDLILIILILSLLVLFAYSIDIFIKRENCRNLSFSKKGN